MCESGAGFGRRCVFICFFCSGLFARLGSGQRFSPTAAFDLSCTLGRRLCLRAEVSIARTSFRLRSGAASRSLGLAAAAYACSTKPILKE
jgi:hypothetical protein